MRIRRAVAFVGCVFVLVACGTRDSTPVDSWIDDLGQDQVVRPGTLGNACYPNNTCNTGLICKGGVCVAGIGVDAGPDAPARDAGPDAPLPDLLSIPDAGPMPDGHGPLWPCANPGQSCNAHDPCAINPICGADKLCHPTLLQNCDDGMACTDDVCKGLGICGNTPKSGFCLATDTSGSTPKLMCAAKGTKEPGNPCKACDPAASQVKWSPVTGGPCDDKSACTKNDYCLAGACKGTYYGSLCADSYACTTDLCDGKGGCLGNTLLSTYCLIGGACYKDGAGHPSGLCSFCDVSASQSAWTPGTNTCSIGGKCYKSGAKHSDPLGCAACDPTQSATAWTVGSGYCLIKDACQKTGDKDATGCASCDPAKSQSAWTPIPGTCKIGGVCYLKGAAHAQGCTCDPAQSATAWTPGTGTCVIGSTSCQASGASEPGGCGICDPTKSTSSWTKPASCLAAHAWSKNFGGSSSDYGYGVATDKSGNVYVVGYFYGSANFGGGTLTSAGAGDIFVASFTSSGAHRWSKNFGGTSSDYAYGVAVDSSGNVYVTGSFYGSANFGGGSLTSNGYSDAFLASFTSSGVHRWSKSFGGNSSDYGRSVAVDGSGNVYVTGNFYNYANFGGTTLTSNGSNDIYVASFTSGGVHRWSKSFGSTSSDYGYGVAVDTSNNVYVTGSFYLSVNFGGTQLTSTGGGDIFLASFTSTGVHRWSKNFGGSSYDYGYAVTTDSSNHVTITGYFYGSANFGGGLLTSNGSGDIFLASFTSTGVPRWAKGFGGANSDYGYGVAADGSGNVYLTGYFYNNVNFGGGTLTSNGSGDLYVASFSSTGAYRWARNHGSTSSDYGRAVSVDSAGDLYVTGNFYGSADLGGGILTSNGSFDVLLLKLDL